MVVLILPSKLIAYRDTSAGWKRAVSDPASVSLSPSSAETYKPGTDMMLRSGRLGGVPIMINGGRTEPTGSSKLWGIGNPTANKHHTCVRPGTKTANNVIRILSKSKRSGSAVCHVRRDALQILLHAERLAYMELGFGHGEAENTQASSRTLWDSVVSTN